MLGGMPWCQPSFPHEPQGGTTLETVDDALLTRYDQGRLRSLHRARRWIRGAVHDAEGRLLPSSQKVGDLWLPADPDSARVPENAERREGTWLYGGHWMRHFGHFVTETVPTLWPRDLQVDGLIFHQYFGNTPGVQEWQQRLVDLTGYAGLPIEIVRRRPVSVERLVLPSRSVVVNGWAQPEAADVWRRMAERLGAAGPHARVFASRTRHNQLRAANGRAVRTTPERDAELDRVFEAAGFFVVSPELLDVDDQIRLFAGARVVAGAAGSALHMAAFAPPGTRVIEIGDNRSRGWPVPMQLVIDTVCGHEHAYIPAAEPAEQIASTLEALGVHASQERS
ncbi:MAG: capsular polysaccharide biosynthesisprotein-like protein [Nocardioides sp.]|nr:capsular polysaccharide biosynthesisprotein-like protein [Nocardioides sp.]